MTDKQERMVEQSGNQKNTNFNRKGFTTTTKQQQQQQQRRQKQQQPSFCKPGNAVYTLYLKDTAINVNI